jgi:polyisoprenoid-binding protein YceI
MSIFTVKMNNKMRTFFALLAATFLISVCAHGQMVTWQLDTAQVQVEGTSSLHDWTVQVPDVKGTLQMDGHVFKQAALSFGVATMVSGRGVTMDDKVKKALKNDTYPQIFFKSEQITATGGQVVAKGTLEIAGVSRTIEVTCTSDRAGHYIATVPLTFSQFEIEPPSALFGSIVCGDELTIRIDLEFKSN